MLIAGSAFNFLIGLLILLCIYSGISTFATPTITRFMDGFPCQGETMLMEGDEILSVDGKAVLLSSDVSTLLALGNGETVDLVVRRDGEKISIQDLPLTLREYEVNGQTVLRYGFYFGVEKATIPIRLRNGCYSAVNFVRMVWWSLEQLFTGGASVKDLTGPIGIVGTMSEMGEASPTVLDAIINLLNFSAFIAINLSVMNMLPIPALDGGRVLFLLLNEVLYLIAKRQIPARYEQYVHIAGMMLLLALMVVVAFHDVYKIVV